MQPAAPAAPPATNSGQALGQLQAFQGQMQAPQDIYKSQEQSLGVPQAQQQVSGLRQAITNTTNLLNQVAPSVYGRTQNSLVTDAQATRQIGNEQAPINTQLNKESTDLTGASSDLNTLEGRAGTMAGLAEQGQQTKLSNLQGIYQALYGQEQDTSKMAEAKRQFDATLADTKAARAGGSGLDLNSLTTPGGAKGPLGSLQVKTGNAAFKNPNAPNQGYAFTGANNKPVSAGTFATQNNIPIGTLLYQMASNGDQTAASAYRWLQSIQGTDMFTSGKFKNTPAYKNFSSLFWGA